MRSFFLLWERADDRSGRRCTRLANMAISPLSVAKVETAGTRWSGHRHSRQWFPPARVVNSNQLANNRRLFMAAGRVLCLFFFALLLGGWSSPEVSAAPRRRAVRTG